MTASSAVAPVAGEQSGTEPAAAPDGQGGSPRRWRRLFPALVTAGLIAAVVVGVLGHSSTSQISLAPDNPQPAGAQAAATILEREGVQIRTAHTAADAIALAEPGTTLFVSAANRLDETQLAAIGDTEADLVLTNVVFLPDLEPLTDRVEPSPVGSSEPVAARCDDPHASVAGELSHSSGGLRADDVELCFPAEEGTGAFASWSQDGRQISVLADGAPMSNASLAEAGNAALTLRILGQHEELVWYLPSAGDTSLEDDGAAGETSLLPPAATAVGWQLAVVVAVLLLWRARRLGPVVTEPMPVVVRSAETTLGRGRLYRRGRAHAHAAAGLRAGCATRLAHALGLARSAPPGTLVSVVAAATGRDEALVGQLLYGPAPRNDAELLTLTRELDILESEVHRS